MRKAISRGSALVLLIIISTAVFALSVSYLHYLNNSFPSQIRNFDDYATISSYSFNGSLFKISIKWLNSSYSPLYAQLVSNEYATAVYDIGSQFFDNGTVILPFPIQPAMNGMTNVTLLIAVGQRTNQAEFTIYKIIGNVNSS